GPGAAQELHRAGRFRVGRASSSGAHGVSARRAPNRCTPRGRAHRSCPHPVSQSAGRPLVCHGAVEQSSWGSGRADLARWPDVTHDTLDNGRPPGDNAAAHHGGGLMHRMPIGIASGRRSPREWIPTLVVALVLAAPATADVVVKQKIVSEGLSGFANGTVNSTMIFSGDKSRSEDEATYTGRFKTLAGKKPGTSIS